MDYAILLLIAGCLGAGVGGGLLSAWFCHRRVLALETSLPIVLEGLSDRLNQLSKIVIRQDKSEAAKARWSGKELKETAEAQALLKLGGAATVEPALHPWNPRTWETFK